MNYHIYKESPFQTIISFHKLIEILEQIATTDTMYRADYAKAILKEIEAIPQLKNGITDYADIKKYELIIQHLLADLFPTALTHNEIKAVTIPFQNFTFNYTERFKNILANAGSDFDMSIRNFDAHQFYINNCCLILKAYYKQNIDFNKPFFYDIPDKNGVIYHYRILYNADFMEIIPTEKAVSLTQEDIDLLIDNYNAIDLWKEKFPEGSWILKGFGIITLFDATTENAISILKTNLIKSDIKKISSTVEIENIFKSIFKIENLHFGFVIYNSEEKKFIRPKQYKNDIKSFIMSDTEQIDCGNPFFGCSFNNLLENSEPFVISNVEQFALLPGSEIMGQHLLHQNIKSCVFAPILKDDKLLGIIELVSEKARELNSVNATKLDLILPYLVDTIERYNTDKQHQIEAIIQREYTTIHPSVYWKFKQESEKYFDTLNHTKDYILKEIIFKEVYPLYGQIDVKSSSNFRNKTVKEDLKKQLSMLLDIVSTENEISKLMLLEQRKFELQSQLEQLNEPLRADTEQQIQRYIETEIHPLLKNPKSSPETKKREALYFENLDEKSGMFYHERKKFDNAMAIINKKLANILDQKQVEAQQIYPHYYERFKTDGVEHNLYIGASITPSKPFDILYLHNLRLWQLQTLCEMELEHHYLKTSLPYELDVTSLILAFSSPISIRFRMDEKRFDVDGTYNARYEIVKKRIDKAHIKGTLERITEKEKITIVYSHSQEESEYLKYIKYLQFKNILEPEIEQFEIEDLQGVSGLKGIRVKVKNTQKKSREKISYQDLLNELN
ncbi:GAF domain-containing protein [Flavobacterium agrisoli]|uniref:GAF domain-containing protein n=1 Tax=Flavobacterium agrisoli TaxID=2793066 RepID=A0A934PJD3_9FLAO|nr:GAF domain-containing protein [Flavobacterium agrisoli]MBK0369207.1 GAF domain-containing protein [Flavobacterium agrisoli]